MSSFAGLSVPKTLDISTTDIIEDFFAPVLAYAVRYDRGRLDLAIGQIYASGRRKPAFLPLKRWTKQSQDL